MFVETVEFRSCDNCKQRQGDIEARAQDGEVEGVINAAVDRVVEDFAY